ncbi:MAG TPA: hypothetical protein VN687_07485 [Blastocatellia bacterium]|nr:hypothetical protein [Blastocatellia bacterium]
MNPEADDSSKKAPNITIGTGIKLGIGISIGVLIVLCGLLLLGVLLFRQSVSVPTAQPATIGSSAPAQEIAPKEDLAAKFENLSQDEKLRKRLAGVEEFKQDSYEWLRYESHWTAPRNNNSKGSVTRLLQRGCEGLCYFIHRELLS